MAETEEPIEPDAARRQNRRAREFQYLYGELPPRIQALGIKAFELFEANPLHPSLALHRLKNNSKGSHRDDSYAVSITTRYRAVYFTDGDTNVWYWVGTHAEYNRFTGGK